MHYFFCVEDEDELVQCEFEVHNTSNYSAMKKNKCTKKEA
jgi:hypothetical protein